MHSLSGGQPSFNAARGGIPPGAHRFSPGKAEVGAAADGCPRSGRPPRGGASPGLDFFQQSAQSVEPEVASFEVDTHSQRLKRLRFTVCRTATLLQEETREKRLRRKVAMLGATYRPGVEWEPGHVRSLIRNIQQWLRNQGHGAVPIVWVGELQRRGAVHYHAAIWLPKGVT